MHRVLFEEITKDAVLAAMDAPRKIDERKVDAQQARRILDRLVGYKASPILWRTIKTGLSAGRVQTVALRLIVEREREIRAFKPQEYWTIEALLRKGRARPSRPRWPRWTGTSRSSTTRPRRPGGGGRGAARMPFVVTKVEKRRRNKRPAAPFTTSTLQQEAAKKLGFSSRRTMRAAQDLYEGIDVGEEGPVGLITYMRTDSVRVSDSGDRGGARPHRRAATASPTSRRSPTPTATGRTPGCRTPTRRSARPTCAAAPSRSSAYLEPDQFRLYQLIWQRFVASQMMPAVYDMTVVEFDLGRYLFRATGSVHDLRRVPRPLHRGAGEGGGQARWRTFRRFRRWPRATASEVREITPSQHFTEPPPRFSEASLVKELERLGIGRPSTYSAIISTLSAREYVKVEQRRFFPTELGELVEKIMVGKFPEIFNVEFTSGMENELDRIEDGELGWQDVLTRVLRAVHQGARRGGHERAGGRRARAQSGGPGQGALPQVRRRRSSSRPAGSGPTSRA